MKQNYTSSVVNAENKVFKFNDKYKVSPFNKQKIEDFYYLVKSFAENILEIKKATSNL